MVTASEMSTGEAAQVLGMASEMLRAWVKQGKVPVCQSPLSLLFDADAVHQFVAGLDVTWCQGTVRTGQMYGGTKVTP